MVEAGYRYNFFETDTGRYYREFLIIVKFKFAYRPMLKRSNIGRYIGRSLIDMIILRFMVQKFSNPFLLRPSKIVVFDVSLQNTVFTRINKKFINHSFNYTEGSVKI